MNEITSLINSIQKYLLLNDEFDDKNQSDKNGKNLNLIRKHTDHLNKFGDLSFPIDFNIWKYSLKSSNDSHDGKEINLINHQKTELLNDIFTYRNRKLMEIITTNGTVDSEQESKQPIEENPLKDKKDNEMNKLISTSITENWSLRIKKAKIIINQQQSDCSKSHPQNNKCFIYLDRQFTFRKCLTANLLLILSSSSSSTGMGTDDKENSIQRLRKKIPIKILNVNKLIKKSRESENNVENDQEESKSSSSSSPTSSLSLSEYRIDLIENTLSNLINCSTKYKVWKSVNHDDDDVGNDNDDGNIKNDEDKNPILTILLTNKSTLNLPIEDKQKTTMKLIICGNVINKIGNKLTNITADKYINKRTTDMQLIAQHKYGLRQMENSSKLFFDTIKCCGMAAVIVDLMELKHSSPVTVHCDGINNHIGSSKGASFILYNSARIETLLNTFDKKVNIGYYPALPVSETDLDFSVLKEEEEWQLMFVYIMGFSNLIERAIGNLDEEMHKMTTATTRNETQQQQPQSQTISTHLICSFINGLVHVFSIYYRRIHILTENRPHLIQIIHSRIFLLKCLRAILNKSMGLLNIQPVRQM